ncbi:MAG TPA: helix-turn-helix domain-containing protein [Methanocorpusculum sp.]|nr:helix-turn-helix domain-containing protein [Methanocorpusculum sp.]
MITLEILDDHKEICFCPLHGILDTISRKWALMVIAAMGNSESISFNNLKRLLCNVSSKTLSSTLKELEEHNLIERSVYDTKPPSVRYSLTSSGSELRQLLIPLLEWIERNGGEAEEGCPIHRHIHKKEQEKKDSAT